MDQFRGSQEGVQFSPQMLKFVTEPVRGRCFIIFPRECSTVYSTLQVYVQYSNGNDVREVCSAILHQAHGIFSRNVRAQILTPPTVSSLTRTQESCQMGWQHRPSMRQLIPLNEYNPSRNLLNRPLLKLLTQRAPKLTVPSPDQATRYDLQRTLSTTTGEPWTRTCDHDLAPNSSEP